MGSKEEEAKNWTSEHQEPPPSYTPYGYPAQGQWYGYPQQQVQSQEGYNQVQAQYSQPQYGQVPGQPMTYQPGVNAPQVIIVTADPMPNAPPDHLIFNVIMTLFCCWPIGICAIMKSLECRNAIQGGNRPRAEELSRSAHRLGKWTLGLGIFFMAIFFAVFILIQCIA